VEPAKLRTFNSASILTFEASPERLGEETFIQGQNLGKLLRGAEWVDDCLE
jgi:hypothetical protein